MAKKTKRRTSWFIPMVSIGLLLAAIIIVLLQLRSQKKENFSAFTKNTPQLVFKTLTARKYIVRGTPPGTADKLNKLSVMHVTADVNYAIDFSKIVCDKVSNGVIYLRYVKEAGDPMFPVIVDVDIDIKDVIEVDSIDPEPISEEEAKKVASTVAVVGAGVGAIFGGMVASKLAGALECRFLGNILGDISFLKKTAIAAAGSAVGGAALGTVSYVATKNFLVGRTLSSALDIADKEEMVDQCKDLLAMEMLTMNIDKCKDQKELLAQYKEEISSQISVIMQQLGYSRTVMIFE